MLEPIYTQLHGREANRAFEEIKIADKLMFDYLAHIGQPNSPNPIIRRGPIMMHEKVISNKKYSLYWFSMAESKRESITYWFERGLNPSQVLNLIKEQNEKA